MKNIFRNMFRYKLTAVFFIVAQLIVYTTVFGALGIYNKAYDKEKDRLSSLYKNRIELSVITSKKVDFLTYLGNDVDTGNAVLAGKFSLGVQELGGLNRCEMILKTNEELNYKLISGRLPGQGDGASSEREIAVGREKEKQAVVIDGKKYFTIEGERYEIVGVLGSEKSDYWDYKILLNISCVGQNVMTAVMSMQEYSIELGSNTGELDASYSKIYGNIRSVDEASDIKAQKINSAGESTMENTMARENMKVNIIAYIFCVLNCMIMSEFWIIQRRKEFAIKKAFGMKNIRIVRDIAVNVLELSCFSLVLFLAGYILLRLLNISTGFDIVFSPVTVLATIAAIAAVFLATMIYPVYKIFKFNPVHQIGA